MMELEGKEAELEKSTVSNRTGGETDELDKPTVKENVFLLGAGQKRIC